MKILQINNFHYIRGGADKVYLDTASLLIQHGHEIQFFSSKNAESEPTPFDRYFTEDIEIFTTRSINKRMQAGLSFIYSFKAARNLKRLLKDHKPDIAHIHIYQSRLSSSILPVLRKHKVPIVFSIHEYKLLCPVYTMRNAHNKVCEACAGGNYYNCFAGKCVKNNRLLSFIATVESYFRERFFNAASYGDHFIMVSDFIKNKHLQYKPVLASKATRLYNFIGKTNQEHKEARRGKYFLYFGRLSHEKGLRTLLKAFSERDELPLKIVGTGPMEDEIRTFISERDLKNVEMLGFRSGEELEALIYNAAFSIVPSEWYESFGLTVIESMLLGTPVIASKSGALPELIKEGHNGLLFLPAQVDDLIRSLNEALELSDSGYFQLAENAKSFVKNHFDSDKHYNVLIDIYKNVIQNYHAKG